MKVVYDISVLGLGHYTRRARTGVFRVVENLARRLVADRECDISFCASGSLDRVVQTMKYLRASPELHDTPFCHPSRAAIRGVINRISRIYPEPETKAALVARAMLKPVRCTLAGLKPDLLSEAEIFHSTFYPLPADRGGMEKLRRFVTVYDLIPILFPGYCRANEAQVVQGVVRSIGPDDWAIAISHATKRDLCNYAGIDPARVFVTHLAASGLFARCDDSGRLAAVREKYGIPAGRYVLSLSTLEPRKNIEHTIRCFVELVQQQHVNDLHLVLVGTKGWDYKTIFDQLDNYSALKDRIIITGFVEDSDLAALYSGAAMFVYPSIYEGFGLPPLEAMQCGVPVITSNTSSLPEVVGDAGIMVDPSDVDSLCHSMFRIYSEPSLAAEMAAKSLERAKLFSWERCAQETVRAYKAALEG